MSYSYVGGVTKSKNFNSDFLKTKKLVTVPTAAVTSNS